MDCNEALRLRPHEALYLDSRGLTYLKLRQFDKAIADYDAALTLNPQLASSRYGRGIARRQKGDLVGGDVDTAAAKAIKANIAEQYAQYGIE